MSKVYPTAPIRALDLTRSFYVSVFSTLPGRPGSVDLLHRQQLRRRHRGHRRPDLQREAAGEHRKRHRENDGNMSKKIDLKAEAMIIHG